MNMFPPGRIIFVRPLKQYDEEGKKVATDWDSVWITPEEIIGEGILVSPKVWGPDTAAPGDAASWHLGRNSWVGLFIQPVRWAQIPC